MKKNIILIISIILNITLIIILSIILLSKDNKNTKDNPIIEDNTSKKYLCSLEESSDDTSINTLYLELNIEDDLVKSTVSYTISKIKDTSVYNDMKNNDDTKNIGIYNDNDYSIKIDNGSTDLTKDANGNPLYLNYSEYIDSLKNIGYSCSEV